MIYKSFCLLSVFLLCASSMEEEVISWREDVKLTWNDFKAPSKSNTPAVALTVSGITFEFSVAETKTAVVDFNAKVHAHFYPNKSWYIKDKGDDYILAHEQLHFDLTELYARKFRQQILQLKVNRNIKSQMRTLHEKINKELVVAQNRYDKESDNSVNREFQAKWNTFTNQELAKLEAYKSKD